MLTLKQKVTCDALFLFQAVRLNLQIHLFAIEGTLRSDTVHFLLADASWTSLKFGFDFRTCTTLNGLEIKTTVTYQFRRTLRSHQL